MKQRSGNDSQSKKTLPILSNLTLRTVLYIRVENFSTCINENVSELNWISPKPLDASAKTHPIKWAFNWTNVVVFDYQFTLISRTSGINHNTRVIYTNWQTFKFFSKWGQPLQLLNGIFFNELHSIHLFSLLLFALMYTNCVVD